MRSGLLFARLCIAITLVCSLQAADEPPKTETQPKVRRRFDPEKLRQAREKLAAFDSSKLKSVTWKIGDVTREALVYVPEKSSKPKPLVIAFHGHGGRSQYAARKFAFHEHWPEAVCIYPQGLPTAVPVIDPEGKLPGWQKYIGDQDDRDLKFFDALLKSAISDYAVDSKQVFVAGHSNGGFFTYVLWAARGDSLAAVAPVAANLDLRDFKAQKPKPVLHVAGEQDPIVKFAGQQRTMDQLRKLNGCEPDGQADGKWCLKYTSKGGPPVVTFIHPGGHEIPDGAPLRIVEFFKQSSHN